MKSFSKGANGRPKIGVITMSPREHENYSGKLDHIYGVLRI